MKSNQTPNDYRGTLQAATRHLYKLYGGGPRLSDLSDSQFCVLLVVRHFPNLGISDLADAMVMDRATLVRALRALKRRDYLLVNLDHLDRHRYELTSTGVKKLEEARRLRLDAQRCDPVNGLPQR
ncbi:MarR family winged helix-turn-helix transcriptional regulator [Paraburkholderia sp. ZP32-5]|uniref:MarR family winged helix-turn-helix transcriptional regulator n=1 Tax=Paraburkholderia sp. ZP32-5 TaxID=2883245 RepID=UPI003FA3A42C